MTIVINKKNVAVIYVLIIFQLLTLFYVKAALCIEHEAPEKIYSFANHLFESKNYYRAVTEYKRILFHYPDHKLAKISRLKMGYSFKLGKRWEDAIQVFEEITKTYPTLDIGKESSYQVGEIYYINENYPLAITKFKEFRKKYHGNKLAETAQYKIGWSYLKLENYLDSLMVFDNVSKDSKHYKQARLLAQEVDKFPGIPKKSPQLAGAASALLPGAGQIYTGRYKDGIAALLLNGLFLWGTIESVNSGNEIVAAILAFFEAGWYTGNIYNAVSSAHKYNRAAKRDFINNLQGKYDLFSMRQGNAAGPRLAFAYRF